MKKTLLLLAAVATVSSTFAQGLVGFSSFADEDQIRLAPELGGGFPGAGYVAGLFLASDLSTPLAVTTFIDGSGWVTPPDTDVTVPGTPVKGSTSFVVRAYEAGKTYDTSNFRGQSAAFNPGPLGGPDLPNPPAFVPDISAMNAFTIQQVPEPGTIALAAVGVGALLLRRRK
jgi:hypothetical protein